MNFNFYCEFSNIEEVLNVGKNINQSNTYTFVDFIVSLFSTYCFNTIIFKEMKKKIANSLKTHN